MQLIFKNWEDFKKKIFKNWKIIEACLSVDLRNFINKRKF